MPPSALLVPSITKMSPFLDNSLQRPHQHPAGSPISEVKHKTFLLSPPICVLSFIQPNFFKARDSRASQRWHPDPNHQYFYSFSHNNRVIIKTCFEPVSDFPTALKIKFKPLTWPTKPYRNSPCLPLGPSPPLHCSPILPPSLYRLRSHLLQGLGPPNFFCLECSPR